MNFFLDERGENCWEHKQTLKTLSDSLIDVVFHGHEIKELNL